MVKFNPNPNPAHLRACNHAGITIGGLTMLEIVNGTVIGEIGPIMRGKLYHEGRYQSAWIFGNYDSEIRENALALIEKMKAEQGPEYARLYPNGLELRIWDN
jgi:hypothetical protein